VIFLALRGEDWNAFAAAVKALLPMDNEPALITTLDSSGPVISDPVLEGILGASVAADSTPSHPDYDTSSPGAETRSPRARRSTTRALRATSTGTRTAR
jgi:hypothetical protein